MKASIESRPCAPQLEKAEEPAHEMEVCSLPAHVLSDTPQDTAETPALAVSVATPITRRCCYERSQGIAQAERHSSATHTRPVCERGS
ncbi:hypothetical protein [Pseudomonas sp. SWRI99]|uniref:hypothetical protein n=1 Tax=Pseudomonas sp. SWRI99 TaxID=2745506 RepID=UPI001646A54D|nr:hypothetical protein [Pseudomonas sp. SWRI99]MBC3777105.1 hypothetical protein [Pseudomonas sp. SWRI99]